MKLKLRVRLGEPPLQQARSDRTLSSQVAAATAIRLPLEVRDYGMQARGLLLSFRKGSCTFLCVPGYSS